MSKKRIAVFVSGGGTNLQALIDACRSGVIDNGEIVCVLSSRDGAYALKRAEKAGIPTVRWPGNRIKLQRFTMRLFLRLLDGMMSI